MKIIFITHPSAQKVSPRGSFRPLSKKGHYELISVSEKILEYLDKYEIKKIDGMLSSSAIRCVDTTLKLCNLLRENERLEFPDKLFSTEMLNELRDENGVKIKIDRERIINVIQENSLSNAETILLSVHGDFADILPVSKVVADEINNGFFVSRPITGILKLTESKNKIEENDILELHKVNSKMTSIKV